MAAATVVLSIAAGCSDDQITVQSIPKQQEIDQKNAVSPEGFTNPDGPDRMLAAVLVHAEEGWFFKLSGPRDQVAAVGEPFREFLKSVRFADKDANPEWDLPEGWESTNGPSERFATIKIPAAEGESGGDLELSVTELPLGIWKPDEYERININRWRRQMGLPPAGRAHMHDLAEPLESSAGRMSLVDMTGNLDSAGPMAAGPFASTAGGDFSRPPGGASSGSPSPTAEVTLKGESQEGWRPAPLQASRGGITVNYAAAFSVGEGDEAVEITVSEFGAVAASALLPNVNRWRTQIGLDGMSGAELDEALESLPIGGGEIEAKYIELRSPDEGGQAIFGAVAEAAGRAWFFKLIGPAAAADRERDRFKAYVQSAQFIAPEENR